MAAVGTFVKCCGVYWNLASDASSRSDIVVGPEGYSATAAKTPLVSSYLEGAAAAEEAVTTKADC